MSEALRLRWQNKRVDMLSYCKQGNNQPHTEIYNEPRWKVCFTKLQKKEWLGSECLWCDSTDRLTLDHILPVICGGKNIKTNAQTLCDDCNKWKMRHIDLPLYHAVLGHKEG